MTTPFEITMSKLDQHQKEAKKLQAKLLMLLSDENNGKRGIDEILELARWTSALGGLQAYVGRLLTAKQETLKMQGTEITVAQDVPIEAVQQIMSLSVARPSRIGDDVVLNEDDDRSDDDESDNDDEDTDGDET